MDHLIMLLSNKRTPANAPFLLKSAYAQYHKIIRAVKSHSRALATFQISYRIYIYRIALLTLKSRPLPVWDTRRGEEFLRGA